jgi:hypothetical protein
MKIIDILFGWITKPQYLLTALDEMMCIIEIVIVFPTIIVMILHILETIGEWRERKNKDE